MPKRHAIIFDLGGVLLRTEDYEPRHKWDRRLGLAPGSVEAVVHGIEAWREAQLGKISIQEYWEAVREKLPMNPWELADLQHDFYAGDRFDMEMIRLIRKFRRESLRIGLLSNNTLDVLDQLTVLKLRPLFDTCVISAQIGVMKPAPEAYQAILDQMELAPGHALFVDDMQVNVNGALACGMGSIRFVAGMDFEKAVRDWLSTLPKDA